MRRSILGDRDPRLTASSRIRPGVKMLTAKFRNDETANSIYLAGIKAGESFDAIEVKLKEALNVQRGSPLAPRNVPFFTCRPGDCSPAEISHVLREKYETVREEISPHSRLYEFPLIFPVDDWLTVMPHKFAAWSRSKIRYWSAYDDDGERYCKHHGSVPMVGEGKNRRAKRIFGGRPTVTRGPCDPNECPEYQEGECKLGGNLMFYVPGIGAGDLFAMNSSSFYSMDQWRTQMDKVRAIRGSIAGSHHNEAIFWMSKRQEEVSRIDPETGESMRTKQWLSLLEIRVSLEDLSAQPLLSAPDAAAALEAPIGFDAETGEVLEEIDDVVDYDDVPF